MAAFRLLTLFPVLILSVSFGFCPCRHLSLCHLAFHTRSHPSSCPPSRLDIVRVLDVSNPILLSRSFIMLSGSDNVDDRSLSSASYASATGMTVESCISFCSTGANSYIYAGVEYADECCELARSSLVVLFYPICQSAAIPLRLMLQT